MENLSLDTRVNKIEKRVISLEYEIKNIPTYIENVNMKQSNEIEDLIVNMKNENYEKVINEKDKRLKNNNKWFFWIITSVLFIFLSTILGSYLNAMNTPDDFKYVVDTLQDKIIVLETKLNELGGE